MAESILYLKDYTNIELVKDNDTGRLFIRGDLKGETRELAVLSPAYPDEGASIEVILPPNLVIF